MGLNTDIATHALIITLKTGLYNKPATTNELIYFTKLLKSIINNIYARAIQRGFNLAK